MGIFSRRSTSSQPAFSPTSLPGRKLRTSLSVEQARQMFEAVAAEVGGYTEFGTGTWMTTNRAAPDAIWTALANGRPALFMAAWAAGDSCDLELVPVGNAGNLPTPMIGTWKMRDGSLSSTGTVNDFPVV